MDFYWHNNLGSKLKDWHKKGKIEFRNFTTQNLVDTKEFKLLLYVMAGRTPISALSFKSKKDRTIWASISLNIVNMNTHKFNVTWSKKWK